MKTHLYKETIVEAAHHHGHGGPAQRRLHGHSYRLVAHAAGEPDPEIGWIVDFAELKRIIAPIAGQLDHALLNDLPGLEEDTRLHALENWIAVQLAEQPAWLRGVSVSILGDLAFAPHVLPANEQLGLPERTLFTFEAAQSLPQLPPGHPCRRVHGHSYRVEAAAVDPAGLEAALRVFYDRLDHQFLNEMPGLESATVERICEYFWRGLLELGVRPTVVSVQETMSARCVYRGE